MNKPGLSVINSDFYSVNANVILNTLRWIILLSLAFVVLSGLFAVFLPAFGWLPALGGNELTLSHWYAFFDAPGIKKSIGLSLSTALITTTLSVVCVFLYLAAVSQSRSIIQQCVLRLLAPILSIPHAAAAFGVLFLFSPSGLIFRWVSPEISGWQRPPDVITVQDPWGISLSIGLLMKEIPFLLLVAFSVLPQLNVDKSLQLARSLGYSKTTAWLKIVAPQLYSLMRMPIYAVLVFSSSTVDIALILGPNLPNTLSVSITHWFNDPDLTQRFVASVGAVCQLMVTLVVMIVWRIFEIISRNIFNHNAINGIKHGLSTLVAPFGKLTISSVFIINILGIFVLIINSIAGFWRFPNNLPKQFTTSHWLNAQFEILGSLSTTLIIALSTVTLAILVVLILLESEQLKQPSKITHFVIYSPLMIPQVGFISGLVILSIGLKLNPGLLLVIVGHLIFVIPYTYLTLAKAYQSMDIRWLYLSQSLGAHYWKTLFRIKLPLLTTPLLSTFALAFSVSIAQYLSTQLLGAGRITTLTTEAIALSSSGNRRLISIWALCQAVLPCFVYLLALLLPKLLWRRRKKMQLT